MLTTRIIYCRAGWSQDTSSQATQYFKNTDKAKIYFTDTSFVYARLHSLSDSTLSVVFRDNTVKSISITDIKTIKVQRQAFWLGAVAGALTGYFGGYGYGYITYNGNDNEDSRRSHSILTGIKAGAPAVVLGGIIGAFVIKKKFIIQGRKEQIEKMHAVL